MAEQPGLGGFFMLLFTAWMLNDFDDIDPICYGWMFYSVDFDVG